MNLLHALRPECIAAGVAAPDKPAALAQAVALAKRSPILDKVSEAEILEGLRQREELGSTGFGRGIAIPHCRLESVSDFVVGVLTVPDGVEFDAADGERVNVVVFIVAPARESKDHIRLLSAISQTLLAPGAIDAMLAARAPEALRESFLRLMPGDADSEDKGRQRSLFHVVVQEEGLFDDALQVFTAAESASVTVLEGRNAGVYLAKIPLFSAFWGDAPHTFCRILLAVVDKELTNETIRRLEGLAPGRDDALLITVIDTLYASGGLGA
ncbi:MAG: PTS sugar transporter subunit IIA [Candidatus Hydrogenedentes bacterium]|nr:PTS sugar transporter subunit IIA [Candidatus Hydrogenedentota bacterium]